MARLLSRWRTDTTSTRGTRVVTPEDGSRYPVYVRRIRRTWWLRTGPFRRFAAREVTSMFAAAFSVIMLLFLVALSRGPGAYRSFLRWLDTPWSIALSAIILG